MLLLGVGAVVLDERDGDVSGTMQHVGRPRMRPAGSATATASATPTGTASATRPAQPAEPGGSSTAVQDSSGAPTDGDEPSPQDRVASAPQYYIDDAGPMAIALTLDDGPHPVYTPQVLDILDRYGIQATFNMIGEQVGDNVSLVREVAAAGHTITNHTWDHADMREYSLAQVLSEIDRCNDALADVGQEPRIFRAPFGYWTSNVFEACAQRDLNPLGWSVDPDDWDTDNVTTEDIVDTVLSTTHRHDIILEHDGGGDRSNTVAALQIFIPELLERGFVFAAV
jgi:peptidoglycan/xylan/chitin deacetylase (PgdA/CDA1 family)